MPCQIAGTPQIPAGHRAPWPPPLGAAQHVVGLGQHGGGDGLVPCDATEGQRKALAHAVVGDRQHVWGGPAGRSAASLPSTGRCRAPGEALDDLFVRMRRIFCERGHGAIERLCRQIAQGERLASRRGRRRARVRRARPACCSGCGWKSPKTPRAERGSWPRLGRGAADR